MLENDLYIFQKIKNVMNTKIIFITFHFQFIQQYACYMITRRILSRCSPALNSFAAMSSNNDIP